MFSAASFEVIEFKKLTRTAQEAAEALGCEIGQIAKSIVFKTEGEEPVLVVASGANRINEEEVEAVINKKILKADAEYVRENSGFVIGGVPPWGHKVLPITLIDVDLKKYNHFFAAAGKNNAVFKLTFQQLLDHTNGKVVRVTSR